MLNYSINDERTLVPENKSASQGKNMAARELIKRLNREFARELKKITFDRTGKIPERQKDVAGCSCSGSWSFRTGKRS